MSGEVERIHGTAIAVDGRAALIRGPSGAGKSDLALRCLGLGPSTIVRDGVILVADDQVELKHQDGHLTVSAPAALRGKIEIRGLGILEVDAIPKANLVLVVDLIRDGLVERYPDPWLFTSILDFDVPVIRIFPFETSSALKLVAAIHMAPGPRVSSKA